MVGKWLPKIILVLVTTFVGCSGAPNSHQYVRKSLDFVTRYLNSDAQSAEAALLEWERYALQCQQGGTKGVRFDQQFAAIYGRLSLVSKHLGKNDEAEDYFQKALDWSQRASARDGRQKQTPEQVRSWIEDLDRFVGVPLWKKK